MGWLYRGRALLVWEDRVCRQSRGHAGEGSRMMKQTGCRPWVEFTGGGRGLAVHGRAPGAGGRGGDITDGGETICDIAALACRRELFGDGASPSTLCRTLDAAAGRVEQVKATRGSM